ncbi:MAG TPA: transglycosylase domain-containing protein [Acidimicrobiales bacterium]|jgi:penicillin-binding protein 1A|nr:transglycosylase domain-containing protein [Acidimicrobiales bacterium]
MRRLLRLIAILASASVLISGTLVALATLGSNAVHEVASASEIPLPPISSVLSEPSSVYADDGTLLYKFTGPEQRTPVTLKQVSKTAISAVLDTEDHGFYQHGGFDVSSIVRAFVDDAQGDNIQGGSTIPQQLVKQLYLTSERTLNRKIREAVLADRLEQQYGKDQILQAYLNTIYLGHGAYGVQAAAKEYFGEAATKLNLPQAAMIAGLISDPSGYDPILHPAAARTRRAQVLSRMVVYGDITVAQENVANNTPLPTVADLPQNPPLDPITNYYVLQVRNFLLDDSNALGATYQERYQALFNGGLKIYTNLDPAMQANAEAAVANDTPTNSGGFIEGLVSIDPATGAVRALVGGPGTDRNQFDVMTQGARQPGSGFKLFTLLAALKQGYSVYDTVDSAAPCYIKFPGNTSLEKTPIKNDAGPGGGPISLVTATAQSVNCAYIRLAHEVGLPNVLGMAYSLGISQKEVPPATYDYIPSVVIGAAAVAPVEMAGAYAAVANGGVFHKPSYVSSIEDRSGAVIYRGLDPGTRVVSTQVAAEADVALRAVVTSGTGTAAELYGRQVAGKTGTTSNNVDAWFNGFTPQLETTVWMGNFSSDSVPIYICTNTSCPGLVYGANYPAETWHDYAYSVLNNQPVAYFPTVSNYLLPATRYITSPSLVADDVKDHNGGYSSCSYQYTYPTTFTGGTYCPTHTYTYTTTPRTTVSPPTSAPPVTNAPPTTQPKSPPTTVKKKKG